jgi:hypothetical protein
MLPTETFQGQKERKLKFWGAVPAGASNVWIVTTCYAFLLTVSL